jgi:hypothetical protein
MVTFWIILGLLAVLLVAAAYDTRRRRQVLQANLPAGASRVVRRKILRQQRTQARAEQSRYTAGHPYMHGGGDVGGL